MKKPGVSVSSKDLIIANHSSYLDILYFAYRYSPQFTSVAASGLTVVPITLFQALKESITDLRTPGDVCDRLLLPISSLLVFLIIPSSEHASFEIAQAGRAKQSGPRVGLP